MQQIMNQYSFLIMAAVLGVIITAALWRMAWPANRITRIGLLVAYVLLVAAIVLSLNFPDGSDDVDSLSMYEAIRYDGQPTFVMLYSHF